MLNRQRILERLREAYPYLKSEYGVNRIGLFGSYAKGDAIEASDIDLIVEFERPIGFKFIELVEYLEHLLGKPVDVLTPAGVCGIRLPHIADEIRKDRLIHDDFGINLDIVWQIVTDELPQAADQIGTMTGYGADRQL